MGLSTKTPWAVVLAAGEGTRLRSLTRFLYGEDRPKQFAVIEGERSLLQWTLDRIATRFPVERTIVVVGKAHEAVARQQLREYEGVDLIVQPRNVGTAPGILLPLARIRARDPGACVAVFPSDHYATHPERLLHGVDVALDAADRSGLTLIGVEPDRAETEYGWIVPDGSAYSSTDRLWSVNRFVEKPDRPLAQRLLRQGALWNTFIICGRLSEFWAEARQRLPGSVRRFDLYVEGLGQPTEELLLEYIYRDMEISDFSRDVLQKTQRLAVVRVSDSGWSDWGSPRRVFESLRGSSEHRRLLARIANSRATASMPLGPVSP